MDGESTVDKLLLSLGLEVLRISTSRGLGFYITHSRIQRSDIERSEGAKEVYMLQIAAGTET